MPRKATLCASGMASIRVRPSSSCVPAGSPSSLAMMATLSCPWTRVHKGRYLPLLDMQFFRFLQHYISLALDFRTFQHHDGRAAGGFDFKALADDSCVADGHSLLGRDMNIRQVDRGDRALG